MIFNLRRFFSVPLYSLYQHAWTFILCLMLTIYFGGYALMSIAGETEILQNYTWWFIVTVTTVGYGDYSPATTLGRTAAVIIMLVGIGALTLLIAKTTHIILKIIHKRSKGLATMKNINHTIIMGYRKGSTEIIIDELLSNNADNQIVLCSSEQESNPINNSKVDYVKGELASPDVICRSGVNTASKIIVHGSDDNQTFFAAYAVREINQTARLVCYLQNEEHTSKISNLAANEPSLNQSILPVNVYLLAQELQDPESSSVFQHLISNMNGATLFRVDVPKDVNRQWSFEDIFLGLKKQYQATVIALKNDVLISNPGLDQNVRSGTALFYIAEKRLKSINWDII